jgi:hypothetical protein
VQVTAVRFTPSVEEAAHLEGSCRNHNDVEFDGLATPMAFPRGANSEGAGMAVTDVRSSETAGLLFLVLAPQSEQ